MQLLPAIEKETGSTPDSTVIWLHGLGADGNDFAPIIPELRLPSDMEVRFIFPHAPSIPVTVNGGYIMPAWYDIFEMDIDRKIDTEGLLRSVKEIDKFVRRELDRGISSKRIVVAGFSQGGAVAYHLVMSHNETLGGLLAMSTYFATSDTVEYNDANREIPIKIMHGEYDPVVPETLGRKATTLLVKKGYTVSYQNYPMEHNVCPEQIGDISSWLQGVLR